MDAGISFKSCADGIATIAKEGSEGSTRVYPLEASHGRSDLPRFTERHFRGGLTLASIRLLLSDRDRNIEVVDIEGSQPCKDESPENI